MKTFFWRETIRPAFAVLTAILFLASTGYAEETVKARKAIYESGANSGKSGYVDMAALLNGHKKSAGVIQMLQDEAAKKGLRRKELLAQIEELAQNGTPQELAVKHNELKTYDEHAMAFLDQKQQELFAPVFQDMEVAIQKYGAENQYTFIYPEPHPGAADVTQEILKWLH